MTQVAHRLVLANVALVETTRRSETYIINYQFTKKNHTLACQRLMESTNPRPAPVITGGTYALQGAALERAHDE